MTRGLAALASILLLALLVAPAAPASTASRSGSTLSYSANPGERNEVTLSEPGFSSTLQIEDTAGITAGSGCTQESGTAVKCGSSTDLAIMNSNFGDGDDVLHGNLYTPAQRLDAGPGNDQINTGSSKPDVIVGGDGNDTLDGEGGDDQVAGGAGNDTVNGGSANDLLDGGSGQDTITGDGSSVTPGSDKINSRDGERDSVSCDLGADSVTADRLDVIEGNGRCEQVDLAAGGGASSVKLKAAARASLLRFLRRGFKFRFTVSGPCALTASLAVRGRRIASGKRQLSKAGTYSVKLKAKRRLRRGLRRSHGFKAKLSARCKGGAPKSRNVRLRR